MHFDIICLEPFGSKREDWAEPDAMEDPVLIANTDYIGYRHSDHDRKMTIKSKWFKTLVSPYATIDTEKETITFLDRETIRKNFQDYLIEVTEKLHEQALERKLSGFEFRFAGREWKGYPTLFYMDGCGRTNFEMFEYAEWYADQTYQIGYIYDAHV